MGRCIRKGHGTFGTVGAQIRLDLQVTRHGVAYRLLHIAFKAEIRLDCFLVGHDAIAAIVATFVWH